MFMKPKENTKIFKNNNRAKKDNVVSCSLLQEFSTYTEKSFLFLKITITEISKIINGITKIGK